MQTNQVALKTNSLASFPFGCFKAAVTTTTTSWTSNEKCRLTSAPKHFFQLRQTGLGTMMAPTPWQPLLPRCWKRLVKNTGRLLFSSESTTDTTRKPLHSRSELFQYRKWDINQLRAVLSDAPTLNDIIHREQIIPFLAATNYREFSQIASRYL